MGKLADNSGNGVIAVESARRSQPYALVIVEAEISRSKPFIVSYQRLESACPQICLAKSVLPCCEIDRIVHWILDHGHYVIIGFPPFQVHFLHTFQRAVGMPQIGKIKREPEIAAAVDEKRPDIGNQCAFPVVGKIVLQ